MELNIVVEPATPSKKAANNTRNNNNYNKKRNKKNNKQQPKATTTTKKNQRNEHQQRNESTTNITTVTKDNDELHTAASKTSNASLYDESTTNGATITTADTTTTNAEATVSTAAAASQLRKKRNVTNANSNRSNNDHHNNNDDTEEAREERAKYAEYLARFHPRIYELDRKSGASKSAAVPTSYCSKHLFDNSEGEEEENDDDDDDDDSENDDVVLKQKEFTLTTTTTTTTSNDNPTVSSSLLTNTKSSSSNNPWHDLQLHSSLQSVLLQRQALLQPTIIQRRTIPFLLNRHHPTKTNVLIQSETGSGKTLAYLLPILQNVMQDILLHQQQQSQSQEQHLSHEDRSHPNTTTTTTSPTTKTLLPISRQSVGTKCIILVPTRELALQIYHVVQSFCSHFSSQSLTSSHHLSLDSASSSSSLSPSPSFHLVAGCLSGGEKRKSEKARLRKGLHILVATPGRLLDHLQTTECFSWNGLQYLVLDEADRLVVDMHDSVQQIVEKLQSNHNNDDNNSNKLVAPSSLPSQEQQQQQVVSRKASSSSWQTILVSATVTPKVQALAQDLLHHQLVDNNKNQRHQHGKANSSAEKDWTRHWHWIKGTTTTTAMTSNNNTVASRDDSMKEKKEEDEDDLAESTPRQLSHVHLTVSAKIRLTTLIAFLTSCVQRQERVVVFMSTCDGVDFHHALFQHMSCLFHDNNNDRKNHDDDDDDDDKETGSIFGSLGKVYKLHGNMPHPERQVILREFIKTTTTTTTNSIKKKTTAAASILLATDVAARGLNLPHVDWIVQYDPPMEVAEYVHRAGRAARAGQAGHALLFLLPSERALLDVLQAKGVGVAHQQQQQQQQHVGSNGDSSNSMTALSLANVLEQAANVCLPPSTLTNTPSHRLGEAFCTEVHRQVEDCIWQDKTAANSLRRKNKRHPKEESTAKPTLSDMATTAFLSYMRAYPTKEKAIRPIFSVRSLHVGHIARSFGLKEAPSSLAQQHRRQPYDQRPRGNHQKTTSTQRSSSDDTTDKNGKKRNAALSFERSADNPAKRQRTTVMAPKKGRNENKGTPAGSGRAVLMAKAARLQQHGMDAF